MKQNHKLIALLLALVLAAMLTAGCAKPNDNGSETGPTDVPAATATVQPTQAPTAAPTPTPVPTPTPEPTEKPDYSGGIKNEKPCTYDFFGTGTQDAYCGTGHRLAVQFYAVAEFSQLGFHSPTWTATSGYALDYELYAWDKDYETTVENEPIAVGHFENWTDGVCVYLKVDNLPAGEYVLLALYSSSEDMHNGGVWYFKDVEREDQISYLDDDIWYDNAIRFSIRYVHTPVNKYGPLSDPGL